MPEKFATLCKMHLSFLLDLDGSKLEDMFGETEEQEPKKKTGKCGTPFSKKKGILHFSNSSSIII